MLAWVTRQADGNYMLTERVPIVQQVGDGGPYDVFVSPGDRLGQRHCCPAVIHALLGWTRPIPRLCSKPVKITFEEVSENDG